MSVRPCPVRLSSAVDIPAAGERKELSVPKYVLVYSGGRGVSDDPDERAAQYDRWERWMKDLGSAIVQPGAATGAAKTVKADGAVDGGSCAVSGYSVLSADDLDAAVRLAGGCPVLEIGGAVDVYEALEM
jgi:hypothetical protein